MPACLQAALILTGLMLFALALSGGLRLVLYLIGGPMGFSLFERDEAVKQMRRTVSRLYGPEVQEDDEGADRMSRDAWATMRYLELLTDASKAIRAK